MIPRFTTRTVELPRDLIGRNDTELLTIAEVARLFHVSTRSVLNWCRAGQLRYVALPTSSERRTMRRVPVGAIREFLRLHRDQPDA